MIKIWFSFRIPGRRKKRTFIEDLQCKKNEKKFCVSLPWPPRHCFFNTVNSAEKINVWTKLIFNLCFNSLWSGRPHFNFFQWSSVTTEAFIADWLQRPLNHGIDQENGLSIFFVLFFFFYLNRSLVISIKKN